MCSVVPIEYVKLIITHDWSDFSGNQPSQCDHCHASLKYVLNASKPIYFVFQAIDLSELWSREV